MELRGAKAFIKGIGFRNIRPALYGWFFNLAVSSVIYFAYYRVFAHAAGDSAIAADITGEIGLFNFFSDLTANYPGNLSLVFGLGLFIALLFIILSVYVSGGIYAVLVEDERTTLTNLIACSSENFFRMISIFLCCIPVWLIAFAIPGLMTWFFLQVKSMMLSETAQQVFVYLLGAISALLFTFALAIYDYARIFKLKEDRGLFQSLKKGIHFTFTNKLSILAIFLLYSLALLIFHLFYLLFTGLVEDLLYTVLVFAAYQGFMMVRYFLKLVVIRAEIGLLITGTALAVP